MADSDDLISMPGIAHRLGLRRPAVSNWRRRHEEFPRPVGGQDPELFRVAEVVAWLDGRKISRKDLQAGEEHGLTYGDRFRANEASDRDPMAVADFVEALANTIWHVGLKHRGFLDLGASQGLVLGLLCLRWVTPNLWRDTIRPALGDEAVLPETLARTVRADDRIPRAIEWIFTRSMPGEYAKATVSLARSFDETLPDTVSPELRGAIGDVLLEKFAAEQRRSLGAFFTPREVVQLMVEVVEPGPGDLVVDPCSGDGVFLVTAAHATRDHGSFTGLALNERSEMLTSLNMAISGIKADVMPGALDALTSSSGTVPRADVVLMNPPFGMKNWNADPQRPPRRWPFGDPPQHDANFAWLQHATELLAPNGRAAVIMPNSSVFSMNTAERTIRSAMVEAGAVECVIALPSGLFFETSIPVTVWLLRKPTGEDPDGVLFIDASELGETAQGNGRGRSRRLTDEDLKRILNVYKSANELARFVAIREIRKRDYVLDPRSYVDDPAEKSSTAVLNLKLRELDREWREVAARVSSADLEADLVLERIRLWTS